MTTDMGADDLAQLAAQVTERYPQARLHKNQVGNLAVMDDGEYVGWLDLRTGKATFFADEEDA